MFLRRFTALLLIVMMLLWKTKANTIMTKLDCSNSDQLCPGTDSITMKCTIYNGYKILVWSMFKATIDFTDTPDLVKSESKVLEGVTFDGELVNDSIAQYESTLTFNPSKEFEITCLSGNSNAYATCQVSFRDPPPAPTNLTSHYLDESSEVLISWTAPPSSFSSDLTYSVTITPPTTTNDTHLFTTTNNSITLDVSSFQRNVTYSVSVNTSTCNNSLQGNSTHSTFVIPVSASSIIPSTVMTTTNTHSTSIHKTTTTNGPSSTLSSVSSVSSVLSSSTASTQSSNTISTTLPATPTETTTTTTDETDETDEEHKDNFLYAVIGGIGGGAVVLIAIAVILVAFSIIIIVIMRKFSPSSNCGSNKHREDSVPHSNDGTIRPPVQDLSPVVIDTPPPLPPRPARRPNFEVRAIHSGSNSLYDNPEIVIKAAKQTNNLQQQSTLFKAEVECQYAIPFIGRFFFSKGNSIPTEV